MSSTVNRGGFFTRLFGRGRRNINPEQQVENGLAAASKKSKKANKLEEQLKYHKPNQASGFSMKSQEARYDKRLEKITDLKAEAINEILDTYNNVKKTASEADILKLEEQVRNVEIKQWRSRINTQTLEDLRERGNEIRTEKRTAVWQEHEDIFLEASRLATTADYQAAAQRYADCFSKLEEAGRTAITRHGSGDDYQVSAPGINFIKDAQEVVSSMEENELTLNKQNGNITRNGEVLADLSENNLRSLNSLLIAIAP